ncbi:formimidoylglutamase [Vibrio cortegadensis]|uniref:Formimidoylglutamase n=1 Tax=Vibrio cortegadensis TaxID=1328770 RepID=A0ABV4MAY3_9VIBR
MSSSKHTSHNFKWHGRDDKEDGALGTRVHHITQTVSSQDSQVTDQLKSHKHVALVGFECDAGVKRNKGRIGAHQAPDLVRQALANMAWHQDSTIHDFGNISCDGDQLESSQTQCADVIAQALQHSPVITLGGGHEVAWASFQGLAKHINAQSKTASVPPRIGIINFDAHFDLRSFESDLPDIKPSSGTPFNQIQHFCSENNWPFHYACLGVSRASNTAALFKRADDLNVWYVEDTELSHLNHVYQLTQLQHFIDACDFIYLTIDLDVFPAATAPGVSAPATRGVSYDSIAPFLERILDCKDKLIIADIAEYNPNFDIDGQTARLAARLCWDIANAMSDESYQKPTI